MTGEARIRGALESLNIIGFGQAPTPLQTTRANVLFQELIRTWRANGFLKYALTRLPVAYVANTHTYSFGPSQTWDTGALVPRPTALRRAVRLSGDTETTVDVLDEDEWDIVQNKDETSTEPQRLVMFRTGGPSTTIRLHPKPTVSGSMVLSYKAPLPRYDLQDDLELPENYDAALRLDLMAKLAVPFNRALTAEQSFQHAVAMTDLKASNMTLPAWDNLSPHSYGQ